MAAVFPSVNKLPVLNRNFKDFADKKGKYNEEKMKYDDQRTDLF